MFGLFGNDEDPAMAHPAMQGFSSGGERLKHIIKSTVKTAAKWALIGGLVLGAVALIPAAPVGAIGAVLSHVPLIGGFFSGAAGTSILAGGALQGLAIGGVAGAVGGALKGIVTSDEALAEAQERRIVSYDRMAQMARNEQMYAMNMQRGMGGFSPGMTPMGRDMDGPGIGV